MEPQRVTRTTIASLAAERAADEPACDGVCVMGNEVIAEGGYFDLPVHAHPDCPRHGTADFRL